MSNDQNLKKFLDFLENNYRDSIKAVYVVGMDDGSVLSDIDLVVILKNKSLSVEKHIKSSGIDAIDVRYVFGEDEAPEKLPYLLSAEIKCVYGNPMKIELLEEKYKLAKLASLFFTSFLRNFYRLNTDSKIDVEKALKSLNDFAYIIPWMKNPPQHIVGFADEIKSARLAFPKVNNDEIKSMLVKAIDYSWEIIELLNVRLKEEFEEKYPKNIFLGTNPTIFVPATAQKCRELSEKRLKGFWRLKILYLPLGFQFIFTEDDKINKIFKNTQKSTQGIKDLASRLVKKIFALCLYFWFYNVDIFNYFSALEAYSTKKALTTYATGTNLLDSEKEAFKLAGLKYDAMILDLGCGAGRTTRALFEFGYKTIQAVDFEKCLIDAAKKADPGHSLSYKILAAEKILEMFPKKYFDAVFFSYNGMDCLYPFSNRQRVIESIYEVLKPRGYFIFSSHNLLCVSRQNLKTIAKNLINVILSRKYLVVDQSFGKILTYFSTPRSMEKEMRRYGFELVKIVPNVITLFPFRDPFPYYVFKRI